MTAGEAGIPVQKDPTMQIVARACAGGGAPGEHIAAIHGAVARMFGDRARVVSIRLVDVEREDESRTWIRAARAGAMERRAPRRARAPDRASPGN